MDLPRLEALRLYHKENPPLHMLVAAYMGVGGSKGKVNSEADLQELMNTFPQTPR